LATGLSVLSYTKAFPNITLPQHLSGQTAVESYLYPGALQPLQIAALAGYPVTWTITITITMD
jgi:hypothetical protein